MAASVLDKYPQWAKLTVTGSAATSGTDLAQLTTGLTTMQKVGWEVLRIEYVIPPLWFTSAIFGSASHYIIAGITQSSSTSQEAGVGNPSLVDFVEIAAGAQVSAVGVVAPTRFPIVHDFPNPILALPQNVFGYLKWATGSNLSADTVGIRLWYREVELGPQDWYDLLQLRLPLGAS